MIRPCYGKDFERVFTLINDAAAAYRGVIPGDCWKEPYMPRAELRSEIEKGVQFWGYENEGIVVAVMGIQDVGDVTLIRHAYTHPDHQRRGIGGKLLAFLSRKTERRILIGTWRNAIWAIAFYQRHGFRLVAETEKNLLLRKYWTIPERQVATSVVLSNGPVAGLVG